MANLGLGFSGILHDPCHHDILASDCVGWVVVFHELKFCFYVYNWQNQSMNYELWLRPQPIYLSNQCCGYGHNQSICQISVVDFRCLMNYASSYMAMLPL